jgi:hypothetical protein
MSVATLKERMGNPSKQTRHRAADARLTGSARVKRVGLSYRCTGHDNVGLAVATPTGARKPTGIGCPACQSRTTLHPNPRPSAHQDEPYAGSLEDFQDCGAAEV